MQGPAARALRVAESFLPERSVPEVMANRLGLQGREGVINI
jgi:hypothetical protein